jgi:hypothetical protein
MFLPLHVMKDGVVQGSCSGQGVDLQAHVEQKSCR